MTSPIPVPERHRFTASDFALTVLGGLVGVVAGVLVMAPLADPATVLIGSLFAQYAGHLLGLWIVVRRRGSSFGALGLHVVPSDGLYVLGGLVLQIVVAVSFIPIAEWIGADEPSQRLAQEIPSIQGAARQAGLILSVALIAPVTEELMFRGLLPRVLGRWMRQWAAFTVAALVFALFHLLGVDPDDFLKRSALLVPQLFIVGLVLGWQVMRRRRLGVAIFLHSGFNLFAVLTLLIAPETFA